MNQPVTGTLSREDGIARLRMLRLELERQGVYAVAAPRGQGPVVEDMTEVPSTVGTDNLRSYHPEDRIFLLGDSAGSERSRETRPPRAGVELVGSVEQRLSAASAKETPFAGDVEQFSAPRRLGPLLAQYVVALWRESGCPHLLSRSASATGACVTHRNSLPCFSQSLEAEQAERVCSSGRGGTCDGARSCHGQSEGIALGAATAAGSASGIVMTSTPCTGQHVTDHGIGIGQGRREEPVCPLLG